MSLLEWREHYARLGLTTIPLRPREKRPLRKGWLSGSQEHWNGVPDNVNIGILTGAPSGGLVVLDFDTRDGPEDVLGMTPEQLAVVTIVTETSRGWHVYARGTGIASSTPREGLDVRSDGGMIVAPPSVHPSGHQYRFISTCQTIVPIEAIAPAVHEERLASDPPFEDVERWIAAQAPRLQEAWRRLRDAPSRSFDASKADFAIACCLAEAGYAPEVVSTILMRLPGSRAAHRGESYALLTAHRARTARFGQR